MENVGDLGTTRPVIEGHTGDEALLLSALVDDYVAADNRVRFIDASVDDVDLGGAGFQRAKAVPFPINNLFGRGQSQRLVYDCPTAAYRPKSH